jgi:condensin complex subunit 2
MSLLREGDGVNFQKASCTLDGCVKIYTNRVDSVATETGKLLSGLADGGNKKKKKGDADGEGEGEEGDEDEEEGEDGVKKRKKRVCEKPIHATT